MQKSLDLLKKSILPKVPKGYQVFLFGSQSDGEARQDSDIDIGFLGSKKLNRAILASIRHEIEESIIPYKVDLVDFYGKSGSFKKQALKKIIVWKN